MSNNLSQATNGLLMQLVMDLKSGYLRRCEALGLSREEMQMLQGLSIEEIHYLSNSEVSVLRLDINHNNLVRMLQQARTEQKRLQRIDRALALGDRLSSWRFILAFPVWTLLHGAVFQVLMCARGGVSHSAMMKTLNSGDCGRKQGLTMWRALTGWMS